MQTQLPAPSAASAEDILKFSTGASTNALLELAGICCAYGAHKVLSEIDFVVQPGDIVGIVGRNGAGKTTMIDLLCGLLSPTVGSVRVFGEMRAGANQSSVWFRSRLGALPQETSLYEDLSAVQNLKFAAALYGLKNQTARISTVLELVGLVDRQFEPVRKFSGGMKRRLAIARTILHDPELLILDEPTVGVDAQTRHQIWDYIRKLKKMGKTIVLATNYLDEAEALCDRVVMLHQGRIVANQTPASLSHETGTCLELACSVASTESIKGLLSEQPGVKRVEQVDSGLLIYMESDAKPEEIVLFARQYLPIQSFRSRSPDLAEIFQHFFSSEKLNS